ncbi:MAG: hypothetical protein AAGG55_00745 [Pseudomonadota bacterium]
MTSLTANEPGLRVPLYPLLYPVIFMAVFAGFQGGRYFLANRLQELGIACALLLFVVGAWQAVVRLSYREWKDWVLMPSVLIGSIMGISSVVFVLNYQGNALYSFFSAREFMLAFMGPGIYLLVRTGLPISGVERTIWFAFFALMVNYLAFYSTMDLREAFFSSDHTISNLVTYDEWRGFRLKPPLFAIMIVLLGSLAMLMQRRGKTVMLGAMVTIGLAATIWNIVLFRATLATMILAVLLYPVLMSHKNRLKLVIVGAPLALIVLPVAVTYMVDSFLTAEGGAIRAKAFARAIEHIAMHPILGAGEDSAYGQNYQDIVAKYFFPSDIGLAGVTYKYGFVGVTLYLYMHCKIWLCLWKSNILVRETDGRVNPMIWGMLIFITAQSFNLMLNPGLAYAQGITAGSLALALGSLHLVRCQAPMMARGYDRLENPRILQEKPQSA